MHKIARFTVSFVGIWCFLRFSAIPLDIFQKVVYTMLQGQDFLSILIDSFRSVFASPAFRNLLLVVFSVFVFTSCIRFAFRLAHIFCCPSHFNCRKQTKSESDKEPSCAFHCDCEDCNSYESGKYCSRCDRFQICAYCSSREHCDL